MEPSLVLVDAICLAAWRSVEGKTLNKLLRTQQTVKGCRSWFYQREVILSRTMRWKSLPVGIFWLNRFLSRAIPRRPGPSQGRQAQRCRPAGTCPGQGGRRGQNRSARNGSAGRKRMAGVVSGQEKTNTHTAFCRKVKRSLDPRCIMGTSGEPVSRYRVKVQVPGRQEDILVSGAPTCLGHRSLFLC